MREAQFDACMNVIDRYILPPFTHLGGRSWFSALRAALQQLAPVVTVGSVPTLLLMLLRRVPGIAGPELERVLALLFDIIFGPLGLLFAACMALELGKGMKDTEPAHSLLTGVLCYLLTLTGGNGLAGLPERIGPDSLLIAAVTTAGAIQLLKLTLRLRLADRLGRALPMGVAGELSAFCSVLASVMAFWGVVRVLPFDLYGVLFTATQCLLRVFDTWYCFAALILLLQLLWFSGVHGGSSIVWGVMSPFLLILLYHNAAAVFSGGVPTGVVTQPLLFSFLMPTGVGLTLPLALFWKHSRVGILREMSGASIKSGVFNINETVLFGAPLIRNRYFFIPFVFMMPLIGGLSGYFLTKAGLIGAAAVQVPWTVPMLLQPLLATGLDWRAAAAQLGLMLAVSLLWLPFARRWERHLAAEGDADGERG